MFDRVACLSHGILLQKMMMMMKRETATEGASKEEQWVMVGEKKAEKERSR